MQSSSKFYRLYEATYQLACWIIDHAGPVAPIVVRLGQSAHKRFIPHSYYDASLNPVRAGGLILHHDQHESSSFARSIALGMYESDTKRLIEDLVKPGMTVLDVGANIGYFSLLAAKLVGKSGVVWAFEPVPHLVDIIGKNIRDNGYEERIHLVHMAVSNGVGTVKLHINDTVSAHSSLYAEASAYLNAPTPTRQVPIEVASISLDAWAAQETWPKVDLVKMDVEGAEKLALEGMEELCRKNPDLKLIIEFNYRTLQVAETTPTQFFAALRACGFDHIYTIEGGLQPLDVPAGISTLVDRMQRDGSESVNLLCEQNNAER